MSDSTATIGIAAAAADTTPTTSSTETDNEEEKIPVAEAATAAQEEEVGEDSIGDLAAGMKILKETKVEGGKSAWATTIETFRMIDGKDKRKDFLCESLEEANTTLKKMVEERQKEDSDKPKLDLSIGPLADFNATEDDLIAAFVFWCKKEDSTDGAEKKGGEATYNCSKAFRRLESYVDWMETNFKSLVKPDPEIMQKASDAWGMSFTHDKIGRLVWWIDLNAIDTKKIKKEISLDDSMYYVTWASHYAILDRGGMERGLVLVESMGDVNFIQMMTMLPIDVGTKLDRLTMGVLPMKMKSMLLLDCGKFLRLLMAMMTPFMSSKMRKRMTIVPKTKSSQAALDDTVGRESIPQGFYGVEGGGLEDIPIVKKFYGKKKERETD